MKDITVAGSKKIMVFQGVRGYAFLLIFVSHCSLAPGYTYLGALGVHIFLVLSGYLALYKSIGMQNGKQTLKERMAIQTKKIYPLHVITLILCIPFTYRAFIGASAIKEMCRLTLNALLLQSYVPKETVYFSYNAVSWYLCAFFLCVIIRPLVVRFWHRAMRQYLLLALAIIGLVGLECILYLLFRHAPYAHWILYVFPFSRVIDYILGGGIFACSKGCFKPIRKRVYGKRVFI